jgi:hypothetical protein
MSFVNVKTVEKGFSLALNAWFSPRRHKAFKLEGTGQA